MLIFLYVWLTYFPKWPIFAGTEISSADTSVSPASLEISSEQRDSVEDVVKDLNIQFNDMDLQETSVSSKLPETLRNGLADMTPGDHCAPIENSMTTRDNVTANSSKTDRIAKDTKSSGKLIPIDDLDDLCNSFSLLRVSGSSSTSESDESMDKTGGGGDHGSRPRMVSNSEKDRKDAMEVINSMAPTTERLESLGDTVLTSSDNNPCQESVLSSPEENPPKPPEKVSSNVHKGNFLCIIGWVIQISVCRNFNWVFDWSLATL